MDETGSGKFLVISYRFVIISLILTLMADEARDIVGVLEQIRDNCGLAEHCEAQERVFVFRPTTTIFRTLEDYYRYYLYFRDLEVSSFFAAQLHGAVKDVLAHDVLLVNFLN